MRYLIFLISLFTYAVYANENCKSIKDSDKKNYCLATETKQKSFCYTTAHLAASLGRPVWLLNRHDTCWRWLLEREDSPWYPSVKIYRQQSSGDWDSVIQSVRNDLIQLITQK